MVKTKWISILDWIGAILSILFLIYFMAWLWLPRIIISELANNPKKIKDNGCLIYAYSGKYNEPMVFINNAKTPKTIRQITLNEFPFAKKMERGLIPGEFRDYKKTCLKIKYIHVDLWIWGKGNYIYDLDD